jgi:hypothetical protein
MKPETLIDACKLAFYSIQGTRGLVLANFFETNNFEWNDKGELQSSYNCTELNAALFKLEMGMKPDWNQVAEEEAWEFAYKDVNMKQNYNHDKSEKERKETYEWRLKDYSNQEEWPKVFRLTKYDHVLFDIPDNITPEWLEICLEYCEAVLRAKTDFDSTSILDAESIEHREKVWNAKADTTTLADELIEKIIQAGLVSETNIETLENLKKEFKRIHFNNDYSNAGQNAKRSNNDNLSAQKHVLTILPKIKNVQSRLSSCL